MTTDIILHFLRFIELGGELGTVPDSAWRGLFAGYSLGFAFSAPRSLWGTT